MPYADLSTSQLQRLIELGGNLVSNLELEPLLTEIVDAAREITGAEFAALGILDGPRGGLQRFITSGIDAAQAERIGSLPTGRGVLGVLIEHPEPIRLSKVSEHPESYGFPPNHPRMESFLGVPIIVDGAPYGNLYLTNKSEGDFTDADEASAVTLAMWAAIAIANARLVREDRLRTTIAAAESERRRWARELHDETLQSLGSLHLLLSSAQRVGDADQLREAVGEAIEQIALDITGLRGLISELRPAALDDLGLEAALESLAQRTAATGDFDIELDLEFDVRGRRMATTEQEITAYRLAQEALTNAAKHARAKRVTLRAKRSSSRIEIYVHDDGAGFETSSPVAGFGLSGMRERVALSGGELTIMSTPGGGTTVSAVIPAPPVEDGDEDHTPPVSISPLSSA
ncbi:MAG: GAF domain-containing protein [Solirubrobacterales bacterium]